MALLAYSSEAALTGKKTNSYLVILPEAGSFKCNAKKSKRF